MTKAYPTVLVLLLLGCILWILCGIGQTIDAQRIAVTVVPPSNPLLGEAVKIGDKDGCQIYRYYDKGWHHFVKCNYDDSDIVTSEE